MKSSTEPMLEPLVLYNNNQLADLDLWDGLFTPVSLLGIIKFTRTNVQNIICLLLKIGTFIKQYSLGNKPVKDFLELTDISCAAVI